MNLINARCPAPPELVESDHTGDDFQSAVVAGLGLPQKRIPSKFFYDAAGSRLFDAICELPEYYPTRSEVSVLAAHAAEIAALAGPGVSLVEFGSGSSVKVRLLLDAMPVPAAYLPVDISREHLLAAARRLAADYPAVPVVPVCADYTRPFELPAVRGERSRVGFFPGSTIGNFSRDEAKGFLESVAGDLGRGAGLLIGVDLRKDPVILHAAYNDAAGVTARFNLNLLARANRELGANFELDAFAHDARWLEDEGRIEMHLVARRAQTVTVGGRGFAFARGESIHTEDSHKYTVGEFQALAAAAGWTPAACWTDEKDLFSVHWLAVG
ncbi:MAG: L-histidine N(alpha)-methyltransferase [Alphaproteobacteria bacterium]|nr:L-histidine N(alpha)-methyltransferase [Alphaproteobacteria bacterium]